MKCEYLGCYQEATVVTKYTTSPGKEIECQVCPDHESH